MTAQAEQQVHLPPYIRSSILTSGNQILPSDVSVTFLFIREGGYLQVMGRVSMQIAFAAMRKLKTALNFRQWTARGKGLVLLNILVSILICMTHQV